MNRSYRLHLTIILNSSQMFIRTIKDKLNLGNSRDRKYVQTQVRKFWVTVQWISINIWSEIPLEIKNKPCLERFTTQYKTCATRPLETLLVFFLFWLVCINQIHWIYNDVTMKTVSWGIAAILYLPYTAILYLPYFCWKIFYNIGNLCLNEINRQLSLLLNVCTKSLQPNINEIYIHEHKQPLKIF